MGIMADHRYHMGKRGVDLLIETNGIKTITRKVKEFYQLYFLKALINII